MSIVQNFLMVFRDTQDIHRVLITIPLSWFISHSIFMSGSSNIAVVLHSIKNSEMTWIGLLAFLVLFVISWAIFTSPFNPSLYVRQSIFVIWTALLHRLSYGLETLGSTYLTTISFVALMLLVPFAVTGLRFDQLWDRYQTQQRAKKASVVKHPAVVSTEAA